MLTNQLKLFITGILCLIVFSKSAAQNEATKTKTNLFFIPEITLGKTMEANTGFPKTNLQSGFFFSIGKSNIDPDKEWAARLNYPRTGLTLGYTDFGNRDKVGTAITLMPFMEFSLFKRKTNKFNLQVGVGASYMDTEFDPETNPFNRAVTTDINWSFRSFFYYDVFTFSDNALRLGLGYLHHSNGHTQLPNQGLNSFVGSVSVMFNHQNSLDKPGEPHRFKRTTETYFETRIGIGQNVLSETFNNKKEVYAFAASMGKIINNTFKFGGGIYYRFYEHYYDYIKNEEALVMEQLPHFTDSPFAYASNFGLFATSELLIDHFGFEFDIGLNIYKPFYKIDWQLNQGYSFESAQGETVEVLGELDSYYEIKRTVMARMGLKYYFWTTNNKPKHNLYLGAHINANLGQADFTELSVGYVYRFNFKEKDKR